MSPAALPEEAEQGPAVYNPMAAGAGLSSDQRQSVIRDPFVQRVLRAVDGTVLDIRRAGPATSAAATGENETITEAETVSEGEAATDRDSQASMSE